MEFYHSQDWMGKLPNALVCIPGFGMPVKDEVLQDEARLLYVAMTRATQELMMTHSGDSMLEEKMRMAWAYYRRPCRRPLPML